PGRLKDYIAMPKMNMYQSLHTTIVGDDRIFEVQIRTEEMDSIAEQGIAAHWRYKENSKYDAVKEQKEIEDKLSWFKDMVALTEDINEDNPTDYMDTLTKDVFEANVYVMTPKGRVIDLPNGATPIDFAYRIHTEVGHTTIGALVNEILVPINTKLKTGDVVELRTSKNSVPSEDWLKFVKTNHAKNKIKNFLAKREIERRQEYIKQGEIMLREEIKKRGFDVAIYMDVKKIEAIFSQFQVTNYTDLMYGIAVKSISLQLVSEKLTNAKKQGLDLETFSKMVSKREKSSKQPSKTGISVGGIDSMKTQLAACCTPVLHDEIVGFVTKGEGIKVHRKECPNVKALSSRLISVYWEEGVENRKYSANLLIISNDRSHLLTDIVTIFSQYKGSIHQINSVVHGDTLSVNTKIMVQLEDVEQLNTIIVNLKKLQGVISVDRTFQ
ncbi:MAG: TGS domain-containing protein, partial [Erysipelotrichaceae bacterium]